MTFVDPATGELRREESYREWKARQEAATRRDNSDIIEQMKQMDVFKGIDEKTRNIILEEIRHGDRQFAERAYRCMDKVTVKWHAEKSRYHIGDGIIDISDNLDKTMGRTFWHEYGHFIDDAQVSQSGISTEVVYSSGTARTIYDASAIARSGGRYDEAVDKDMNAFFARHNLDFESKNGGWIFRSDGSYIDPEKERFSPDAVLIQDALRKDYFRITGKDMAWEYMYGLGYPHEVRMEDYGHWHVSPAGRKVVLSGNLPAPSRNGSEPC